MRRYGLLLVFMLVGLVNFYPVIGVFGPQQLQRLYGVAALEPDTVLLLRHRALLFALVGGLLIAAAFKPALRNFATAVGLASMLSFALLALPLAEHGEAVRRVFWADVVASGALLLGWLQHARWNRSDR